MAVKASVQTAAFHLEKGGRGGSCCGGGSSPVSCCPSCPPPAPPGGGGVPDVSPLINSFVSGAGCGDGDDTGAGLVVGGGGGACDKGLVEAFTPVAFSGFAVAAVGDVGAGRNGEGVGTVAFPFAVFAALFSAAAAALFAGPAAMVEDVSLGNSEVRSFRDWLGVASNCFLEIYVEG